MPWVTSMLKNICSKIASVVKLKSKLANDSVGDFRELSSCLLLAVAFWKSYASHSAFAFRVPSSARSISWTAFSFTPITHCHNFCKHFCTCGPLPVEYFWNLLHSIYDMRQCVLLFSNLWGSMKMCAVKECSVSWSDYSQLKLSIDSRLWLWKINVGESRSFLSSCRGFLILMATHAFYSALTCRVPSSARIIFFFKSFEYCF